MFFFLHSLLFRATSTYISYIQVIESKNYNKNEQSISNSYIWPIRKLDSREAVWLIQGHLASE